MQARPGGAGRESSIFAGHVRYFQRTHHGAAVDQREVKSHRQAGIVFGQSDRMLEGSAGDHQAGAGQNPAAVGQDDGLIDLPGGAEIIAGYNQAARHRDFSKTLPVNFLRRARSLKKSLASW